MPDASGVCGGWGSGVGGGWGGGAVGLQFNTVLSQQLSWLYSSEKYSDHLLRALVLQ